MSAPRKTSVAFIMLIALLAAAVPGAKAAEWYRRGPVQYEKRMKLTLQNPLAEARTEELVALRLDEIRKQAPDFSAASFTLVDPAAVPQSPCHLEKGGNDVPAEAQDADGDGAPDELVFLATLPAKEAKAYWLYYTPKNGPPPPVYPKRTQATVFKQVAQDPHALFAIESEQLLFRFTRWGAEESVVVGDVYGKRSAIPCYMQHLCSLWIATLLEREWPTGPGRSLLYPLKEEKKEKGLGSLAVIKGGKVYYPDKETKLSSKVLLDGRLRSRGEIRLTNWNVDGTDVEVKMVVTMAAGQHHADYEVEATAKGGSGVQVGVSMLNLEGEKFSGGVTEGYVAEWGNRGSVQQMGLAMVFRPGDVAECRKSDGERLLILKGDAGGVGGVKVRVQLGAGWQNGGYVKDGEAFIVRQQESVHRLAAPVRLEVGTIETRPAAAEAQPVVMSGKETFFLSNPANKAAVLPAEIDLAAFGLKAGGVIGSAERAVRCDVVKIQGQEKLFVNAAVPAMGTRRVELQSGVKAGAPTFKVTEKEAEGGKTVEVDNGEVKWMVTGNGLKQAVWKGKTFSCSQGGVKGPVQVAHNGSVVAVVRVGEGEKAVDYCFFHAIPAVKVYTRNGMNIQGVENVASYVAKKESHPEGGERVPSCPWGRVTSERVFPKWGEGTNACFKTDVCYPAEWAALFSPKEKIGLLAYGNPSTGPLIAEKGGRLSMSAPEPGEWRELSLCLIERPEQGEDIFPQLCQPIVSRPYAGGFLSLAFRDGNAVSDAVFAEDRNGNGMPDFAGDKWRFDMNSDDALESMLEFEPASGNKDRAARMKLYCDTVTGHPDLYSENLRSVYGSADRPLPSNPMWLPKLSETCYFDGCLSVHEMAKPFFVFDDWDGDGIFFKGPVTEGGFMSAGQIEGRHGNQSWNPENFLWDRWALECWDFDGDGDNDSWWIKQIDAPVGESNYSSSRAGEDFLFWGYHDLSDVNLEPVAMVDAYRGRATWAARFSSFINSDNGKNWQIGFEQDGEYIGNWDWPFPSGWDIDGDGVAEGHVYFNAHKLMYVLDLLNSINGDDPYVGEKLYLEKDALYTHPTRHENFLLELKAPFPSGYPPESRAPGKPHLWERFPVATLKDPWGHVQRFRGIGVPNGWDGKAVSLKMWPNGTYDYVENYGWASFEPNPVFVNCMHWLRAPFSASSYTAHEGSWGSVCFRGGCRVEVQPDWGGGAEHHLYFSPIVNDYHLKGIRFGIQLFKEEALDVNKANLQKWSKLGTVYSSANRDGGPLCIQEYMFPERFMNDYSREVRKNAPLFLYYSDEDGDGYVDSYMLDGENDGFFEKRMWYDYKSGRLEMCDEGGLVIVPVRLETPEFRLDLKNYTQIVDKYRATKDAKGLLWTWGIRDGRLTGYAGPAFILEKAWLPQVAVDGFHRKFEKDPWRNLEPDGLDTLARVVCQLKAEPAMLEQAWSTESLRGVDVLVAWNLEQTPAEGELAALDAFLQGGGALILMIGPEASEASTKKMGDLALIMGSVTDNLAARFGIQIAAEAPVSVTPSLKEEQINAAFKEVKEEGSSQLLRGVVHPFFLEGKALKVGEKSKAVLQYGGRPILAEAVVGKGKVVALGSNLLLNKFMCMEFELRKHPFKPGNSELARNLLAGLLEARGLRVTQMSATAEMAMLEVQGQGGIVTICMPWEGGKVAVDGQPVVPEKGTGGLCVRLPSRKHAVAVTHGK